jgi:TRAP-type C4-dicarboxylate transport system permease large subunit
VLGFIALLLVVWLVLAVVGAVVEGLFWLLVIGAVLFVATAAFGWTKRNTRV